MGWKRWIAVGGAAAFAATIYSRRNSLARAPRITVLDLPVDGDNIDYEQGSIQFVGTATTVIRYGGFTVLTDPNFLHRGEHVHLGYGLVRATRLTEPALDLEDLPPIDFVVLSHMHEDHFDREVARRLRKSVPILTTPDAAVSLRGKGFYRAYAMDHWDSVELRKGDSRLRVSAMPGRHGPLVVSSFLPSVMGSMLDFRDSVGEHRLRLYVTGDTLPFRELEEIPRRFPEIDIALLHLGGTRVLGILVTMDAEEGMRALKIVAPKVAIPIHYNDYDLFRSPLEDFQAAVNRAGWQDRVHYLRHGESYEFRPEDLRGVPIESEKARS